jgi:threonine/homoserine/homoserine lactone efflux protein
MIAFLVVAGILIVAPGPDFALTVRNTVARGSRAGVSTALGVTSGLTIWAVAAVAGLTALLVASHPAFVTLRIAGGAYLIFLGLQSLWRGLHGSREPAERPTRATSPYAQGLLSNLANPKIAVFFTSLLPQFGSSFGALSVHSAAFALLTLLWLVLVARAGALLRVARLRRAIDAVSGFVLLGLGAHLAFDRR